MIVLSIKTINTIKKNLTLRVLFFISILVGIQTNSKAQLVKQWDKVFGGSQADFLYYMNQTKDGGYILGGLSFSGISGDKTQASNGSAEYWIVKTDSDGIYQWDKDFGGSSNENLYSIHQTRDGGYILGGYSASPASGDKTQGLKGTSDYWIVKIDSLGNRQWDKDFGGDSGSKSSLHSLQQTNDGGYILGGFTTSGIGGDKTDTLRGKYDYWVVKTDSNGIYQWDKTFGGTTYDYLYSLQQTKDGGYILGGYSDSPISGEKTDSSRGDFDYWVIKTDSNGIYQWDKTFGGDSTDDFHSLQQTKDGGYILGGTTRSGISGDKTDSLWGGSSGRLLDYDYWIVKINSQGAKQWDKDFGGTGPEEFDGSISLTSDGGYLFSGTSYSPISGNKTANNLGPEETWIVKTDSLGIQQWDKTLLTAGSNDDEVGYGIQSRDGCYVFANTTRQGMGGDKTQASKGADDYWIIKFCPLNTLTVSVSPQNILCNGQCTGTTTVNPVGGTSPYSYLWSNTQTTQTITGLCAGNYTVTVSDAASSSTTVTVTIPQPSPITTGVSSTPANCGSNNGTATVAASGGTGSFNYSWSSSSQTTAMATGLSAGTYTVTVTDGNNCSTTSIAIVGSTGSANVAGVVSADRDTICSGTQGILSLSSSSGSPVQWQSASTTGNFSDISGANSTGYTDVPLQTTRYRVIVGTGNCADTSAAFILVVMPSPVAIFTYTISGSQITFNSTGTSNDVTTYNWDFNDGGTSVLPSPVHVFTTNDTFQVCLTVFNGSNCSYTLCKYVVIDTATGIPDISAEGNFIVYPNPFGQSVFIGVKNNERIQSVEIYDVLGRTVYNSIQPGQGTKQLTISLPDLSGAMYYVKIKSEKITYIQKLIKLK